MTHCNARDDSSFRPRTFFVFFFLRLISVSVANKEQSAGSVNTIFLALFITAAAGSAGLTREKI